MSSKRGRKVNKDLPPSRARDVQRAFRARRAAHLEALEERVAALEQENALLRAALKLPPSDRPLLGRGPTGKEKPKSLFIPDSNDSSLNDSIRRSSVCTVSTEGSNVSHTRSSNPQNYINGDNSFDFPHWNNALMIHQDIPESTNGSPPVEGHPPHPLKLSPISFFDQPPHHSSFSLRANDTGSGGSGGVSPGPAHSRCNSYGSQSSGASSTSADTFSPVYMLSDVPDNSPTMPYSSHNNSSSSNQHHFCPPTESSFSQFQYPLTSPQSTGASSQQSSSYVSRRDSDHILNISYSRHSPPHHNHHHSRSNGGGNNIDTLSTNGNGHRRAITEPQTLRALVNGYSGPRGSLSGSISSNSIRVPSPPPVAAMDRDIVSPRKFSIV
ncbi:hypothetical protein Clacol_002482 [Clathrus columnatus]|uniref:BZIP domain-containing protein n=1 Tax=Clathrus columnatus TaxID=1419009 RepID=A0AAV5A3T2_9AGAM|nr:hypothetical protein Clacol_002482 [Clathrus columnatus]